jgi:N-acetylneuraminic acid mutarotase
VLVAVASGCEGGAGAADSGNGVGVDAGASRWIELAPLPAPRQETAVVTLGGEVIVIGGFSGQAGEVAAAAAYDPKGNRWRELQDLPRPLHHANAAVVDGQLYVLGALSTNTFTAIGEAWRYDPGTDEWSAVTAMPAGSERGSAVVGVIDGKVYVAGGFRAGKSVADHSVFDPSAGAGGTWTALAPLPEVRDHLVGGAARGKLVAIGGRQDGIENRTGRVDLYDPASNTWSLGAAMLTARSGCAAGVIGDVIYVVGGEGNPAATSGVFAQNEGYDVVADRWSTFEPMRTPRHGMGAAVVEGTLYVPGGATVMAFGATATVEAFTP